MGLVGMVIAPLSLPFNMAEPANHLGPRTVPSHPEYILSRLLGSLRPVSYPKPPLGGAGVPHTSPVDRWGRLGRRSIGNFRSAQVQQANIPPTSCLTFRHCCQTVAGDWSEERSRLSENIQSILVVSQTSGSA